MEDVSPVFSKKYQLTCVRAAGCERKFGGNPHAGRAEGTDFSRHMQVFVHKLSKLGEFYRYPQIYQVEQIAMPGVFIIRSKLSKMFHPKCVRRIPYPDNGSIMVR